MSDHDLLDLHRHPDSDLGRRDLAAVAATMSAWTPEQAEQIRQIEHRLRLTFGLLLVTMIALELLIIELWIHWPS